MPQCVRCGRDIDSWEMGVYYGSFLCSNCYQGKMEEREHSELCTKCYGNFKRGEVTTKFGATMCMKCAGQEEKKRAENMCKVCSRWIIDPNEKRITPEGKAMCLECYHKTMGAMKLAAKNCMRCGKSTVARFVTERGEVYCPQCSSQVAEALREEQAPPIVIEEEETPVIRRLRSVIEKVLKG